MSRIFSSGSSKGTWCLMLVLLLLLRWQNGVCLAGDEQAERTSAGGHCCLWVGVCTRPGVRQEHKRISKTAWPVLLGNTLGNTLCVGCSPLALRDVSETFEIGGWRGVELGGDGSFPILCSGYLQKHVTQLEWKTLFCEGKKLMVRKGGKEAWKTNLLSISVRMRM